MKQILCFGDSNTYGYKPDKSGRFSWGVRWTSILAEKFGRDVNVIEEGLCGRTTIFDDVFRVGRNGSESFPAILESHTPLDLIIIMLGTNDCKTVYGATAGIIGKGVETLLEQVKKYSPDSDILLISPIYLGENVYKEGFDVEFSKESIQLSKNLEAVYEKIALKNNIHFLRAQDIFVEAALLLDDHYNVFCDETWYIYADEDSRRKRLKESRGYSDEKIDGIIKSQLGEEEFKKGCDIVVDNSGNINDTYAQLVKLLQM